jgi:hypothetical protein
MNTITINLTFVLYKQIKQDVARYVVLRIPPLVHLQVAL